MRVAHLATSWQEQLNNVITDVHELCALLQIEHQVDDKVKAAMSQFPLRVPHSFVSRMRKGDLHDPLLRQVLPLTDEMQRTTGFSYDPLQERQFNPMPGVLHKYHGRVLVTLAGSCAINCRYCFRRYFPYNHNIAELDKVIEYLQQDKSIQEIILSGGEPLLMKDAVLSKWINQLEQFTTLKRLRIHTRLPIVIPERITDELINMLSGSKLQVVMVVHSNHPQEIDDALVSQLRRFSKADICALNQAVLLHGVNDDVDTLVALSERLFAASVLPYYLHLLDRVQGTEHFEVGDVEALRLHEQLQRSLPGYLVPKLVRERAGDEAKTPLS